MEELGHFQYFCRRFVFLERMTDHYKVLPLRENVRCTRVAVKRHFEHEYDDFLFVDSIYPTVRLKRHKSDSEFPQAVVEKSRALASVHKRRQSFLVKGKEMRSFFNLLNDEVIQDFFRADRCMRITDKYLIAMVFAYFKRAGYKTREFSRMNFFVALYLANDMEEDDEDIKYEIFPWALGKSWREKFPKFLSKRDRLWSKIDHSAVVSRRCCEEIMGIEPDNPVWQRTRTTNHGGAIRNYVKPSDDGYPKGPNRSPLHCVTCETENQYDITSPYTFFQYSYSGDIFSEECFDRSSHLQSSFDMNGLKRTLTEDEWPAVEE